MVHIWVGAVLGRLEFFALLTRLELLLVFGKKLCLTLVMLLFLSAFYDTS